MIYDIRHLQKALLIVNRFGGTHKLNNYFTALIAYRFAAAGLGILRENYTVLMLKIDLERDLEVINLLIVFIVNDILIVTPDKVIDLNLNGIGKQIFQKIAV